MVYIIFICFAVPLALMLPFLKGQSRLLILFMLIGAFTAVSSAEINGVLQSVLGLSALDTSLRVAPVTEECMKALPILFYALLFTDEQKTVLSLAMAMGIGFAILENTHYLINSFESINLLWALVRGVSCSLAHGLCTFLVGCGILYVRKEKRLFFAGTFGLLTVAITFHATYNLLVWSQWNVAGVLLPIVVYALVLPFLYSKKLKQFFCSTENFTESV